MTVIQGQRFTTHQTTETRDVRDVKAEINLLEPDSYPLVAVMNKAKNRLKVTGNKKYEWFETTLLPRFDVLAANLTAAATSMTVTNYAYFRAGDIVRINKNELVLVTATPSTTSVSIRRAQGNTATTATSGDQLHILANLSDEGETIGSVLSMQKVPQYNYCALMKKPYKVSGTAQATETYGEGDLDFEVAMAIIEHAKDIEYLNLLGERQLDITNETSLGMPKGVLSFISTMVKDAGGTLTEDELEDWVRMLFRYGNKSKILFASSKLCTVINGFGRDKLQTKSDESTYGVTMTEYKNSGRKLMIVEHPLLENDSITDLTGLAGTGIGLDIGDLSYRYMKGRYMQKSQVNPNADSTLYDGTVGQIMTEGGIQLEQEKKHGELTGVTD